LRSEWRAGGAPVGRQPGGPIDDEMRQPARAEDLIRDRAAPARIEDVALEEEEGDTRTPRGGEQVVEPGGIELEAEGIALGVAIGRRRGADYSVDRVAPPGGDQRDKGAEGLPGQDDTPIAPVLSAPRLRQRARRRCPAMCR
jgi:hypothetical protein